MVTVKIILRVLAVVFGLWGLFDSFTTFYFLMTSGGTNVNASGFQFFKLLIAYASTIALFDVHF